MAKKHPITKVGTREEKQTHYQYREELARKRLEHYYEKLRLLNEKILADTTISSQERVILEAYIVSGDIMDALHAVIDIDPTTLKSWLTGKHRKKTAHKRFRELFNAIKKTHKWVPSTKLWDAVLLGEPWAIKAYLSTHSEEMQKSGKRVAATFDDVVESIERSKQG
jgi:hypothetical protein